MNVCGNIKAIHSILVAIFHLGPKLWTEKTNIIIPEAIYHTNTALYTEDFVNVLRCKDETGNFDTTQNLKGVTHHLSITIRLSLSAAPALPAQYPFDVSTPNYLHQVVNGRVA